MNNEMEDGSSGLLHHVVWQKFTDMSEVISTPETAVNFFQTTQRNISEDSIFTLTTMRT
jgi:hypothetical protein